MFHAKGKKGGIIEYASACSTLRYIERRCHLGPCDENRERGRAEQSGENEIGERGSEHVGMESCVLVKEQNHHVAPTAEESGKKTQLQIVVELTSASTRSPRDFQHCLRQPVLVKLHLHISQSTVALRAATDTRGALQ